MANFSLDLSQYKSSGIYTQEFDASTQSTINSNLYRLIVGFSKKGPFNAPVFLQDKKTARQIFGDIDTQLEKKGSFFHRAIFTSLDQGPVFALNLMPVKNDDTDGKMNADRTNYFSYSLSPNETNGDSTDRLYSSFFNKERFWKPDTEYLLANVNANANNNGKLFNMVNLGQTPVSILVRKNASMPQFNVTAEEWYGSKDAVPTYMEPSDYISDYFIDVAVVQGNWTNYSKLAIDPIYSEYFTKKGIKKTKLKDFLSLPHIVSYGLYTGALIPELRDNSGAVYTIDTILNNNLSASVGLLTAINKEALEEYNAQYANADYEDSICTLDVVGHTLANTIEILGTSDANITKRIPNVVNYLSYKFGIKDKYEFNLQKERNEDLVFEAFNNLKTNDKVSFGHAFLGKTSGYTNNVVVIEKPTSLAEQNLMEFYDTLKDMLIPNKSLFVEKGSDYKVISVYENNEKLYVILANDTLGKQTLSTAKSFTLTENYKITGSDLSTFTAGKEVLVFDSSKRFYKYCKISSTAGTLDLTDSFGNLEIPKLEGSETKTGFSIMLVNTTITLTTPKMFRFNELDLIVDGTAPVAAQDAIIGTGTAQNPQFPAVAAVPAVAATLDVYVGSSLAKNIEANVFQSGDKISFGTLNQLDNTFTKSGVIAENNLFVKIETKVDSTNLFTYYELSFYKTEPKKVLDINGVVTSLIWDDAQLLYTINSSNNMISVVDTGLNELGNSRLFYSTLTPISTSIDKKIILLDEKDNKELMINDYVVSSYVLDDGETTRYKLTRIVKKVNKSNGIEVYFNSPVHLVDGTKIVRFIPIDEYAQTYTFQNLNGFSMNKYHQPDGSIGQLTKILGMLDPMNTNLMEVLKSRDIIKFRYIVDTFDGGISPMTYPKTFITRLAKERQKCLALMNAPSARSFTKSNDPIFTKTATQVDPKPILDTYYISKGGNLDMNPSYTFSLPDETNGSKFSGYFWPFIMIRENGRNFAVPPSADVSNLFIQKHKNGQPFHIVAGKKRGAISNNLSVGIEYDCLDRDRDNLEPMGINPIIMKEGVPTVYANQMAYQKLQSSFNSLHVRDILITIEEAIEQLLENYIFDFNTPQVRIEIKNKVSAYLDKVRSLDGISTYSVVMDTSNNPNEVINAKTAVLDIALEPNIGMQKFINRIHVYGQGGIESQGFTPTTVLF